MENKFNVSVILPIKTATAKDFDEYFSKAINSLIDQNCKINELVIVHTTEELLTNKLNSFDFKDINVVKLAWDNEPSFTKQVNHGILNCNSEWVSILEFDDEYSKILMKQLLL